MRQIVFNAIVARFKRQYNRLDEVSYSTGTDKECMDALRSRNELRDGVITIEQYLTPLTDDQLLDVFESQCCQDFR